jgi:L-arabinose isomerase
VHSRHHHIERPIENWSSFSKVDSFGSLGHAIVETASDKVAATIVFAVDIATKGLKLAIGELRN